ncbi:MAG TPA: hypothetical protein VN756_11735 [Solirubrobacterales bacterium]|nr:hypothetical protein [Solirubrobacterales bacterium]
MDDEYETLCWENWGWARKRPVEGPEFGWPQLESLLAQNHAGSCG